MEPLRSANRLSGRALYRWVVIAKESGAIAASSGIEVLAEAGIAEAPRLDNLTVVAGYDAHLYDDKAVFGWLRRSARQGCRMGALSTGSYALAEGRQQQERLAELANAGRIVREFGMSLHAGHGLTYRNRRER